MDGLPAELRLKIFCLLDHRNLATSLQVCRAWNKAASDDAIWCKLFKRRWGGAAAEFFAPLEPSPSRSWKDAYEVQDRCDRVGVGLKIIKEGDDYYLVHQGEIQRCLGSSSRRGRRSSAGEEEEEHRGIGISEKILFFIGDLEKACQDAKRVRVQY